MSSTQQPGDIDARKAALDPHRSFIVQAPAGSGKTELLIQRYLQLLSVVSEPEEVLAITFTRKAAGEMRARIESALRAADQGDQPTAPHLAVGYQLACNVLRHARTRDWQLVDFPTRLRISTIDAVNASLARRVPLSAGVTSQNSITEDTEPMYRAAIRETLLLAEEPGQSGQSIRTLLAHCDNRADQVETYLQIMLERRDQWLRRTGSGRGDDSGARREAFEASLRALVETYLRAVHAALPLGERESITDLLRYAGESILKVNPESPLAQWRERRDLPGPSITDIDLWRGLQIGLQTQKGEWRKGVNKNCGFPPGGGEAKLHKEKMTAMLDRLAEHETFRTALYAVASLPDARYTDSQWALIDALWQVLPLTVAVLKSTFAEKGVTDYTEIAQEAVAALGGKDNDVSDLRLALDYQIKHVLLDEFQDTSRSQFELIERLTEGWELESDRSLFLVGDPMQSIYRFREAEVGLFLDARKFGIGELKLDELVLHANFRSSPAIINWFNDAFTTIFPAHEDATTGAISFVPSVPMTSGPTDSGVTWHPVPFGEVKFEADLIADLVKKTLDEWQVAATADGAGQDKREIGILVRSRRHAVEIGRSLHRENISFTAMGLENLDEQSAAQDLIALTRALLHLGDRIAWLGVLRAPWCGLTLVDLHALASDDHDACVWSLMNESTALDRLSAEGRARLDRCRPILAAALERYGSIALRDLVESTWLQLGGPATVGTDAVSEFGIVDHFFERVGALEADDDGLDLLRLLAGKSVSRGGVDDRVKIMTIHKAKGLEFDTVMLPGLARRTRHSEKLPLLFHEFELDDGTPGLVAAPIAGSDQDGDPIHDLLWSFEREREKLEQDRLLYVAVTRARRQLHLFAGLARQDEDNPAPSEPASDTLLARLWPVVMRDPVAMEILTASVKLPVKAGKSTGVRDMKMQSVPLRRLSANWCPPDAVKSVGMIAVSGCDDGDDSLEFEWASTWAKHVGSVAHRWLQQIAEEGVDRWDAARVERVGPDLRRALRCAGVGRDDEAMAGQRVIDALQGVLADPRGHWLLSQHDEAVNEFPITTVDLESGVFRNNFIDRTFVCEEGLRWIIDYKTGLHEGANIDEFLRSETERHRPQLKRYRDALREMEQREIRTALYFPSLQIFHLVDCDELQ